MCIRDRLEFDADIGNTCTSYKDTPLAAASAFRGRDLECNKDIIKLFLPKATVWSKYRAIISATNELFYSYGRGKRTQKKYESERVNELIKLRKTILLSLSEKECDEFREYVFSDEHGVVTHPSVNEVIFEDMLNFEMFEQEDIRYREKIQRCFANPSSCSKTHQTQSRATFFTLNADEKPHGDTTENKGSAQQPVVNDNWCNIL